MWRYEEDHHDRISKILTGGTNLQLPQECDIVFDSLFGETEVSEGKAISEAFTQAFHYDKPRISCKNLRVEYINPNYIFGDQNNHHWMGNPWTPWTHCKLAFGQNSIY